MERGGQSGTRKTSQEAEQVNADGGSDQRGSGEAGETQLDSKNILKVDLDVKEIGDKQNSKNFTYHKWKDGVAIN